MRNKIRHIFSNPLVNIFRSSCFLVPNRKSLHPYLVPRPLLLVVVAGSPCLLTKKTNHRLHLPQLEQSRT